jgi:hypothetical protein
MVLSAVPLEIIGDLADGAFGDLGLILATLADEYAPMLEDG